MMHKRKAAASQSSDNDEMSASVGDQSRMSSKSMVSKSSLAESLATFGNTVMTKTSTVLQRLGIVREEGDNEEDPPAPSWGLPVDQDALEHRNKRSKQRKEDLCEQVLENVGKTVKDCKNHLVLQSAESMFIAAAVGEGLDREGKNKDSVTNYKALNEGKRNQVLRLKKAAVKMMQNNHGKLPVLYLEGTCDETRTYIEHGICYYPLSTTFLLSLPSVILVPSMMLILIAYCW